MQLLADGHDVRALRRFAGFQNLREARDFARTPEVRAAVAERVRERAVRLGARSLRRLQELLDSPTTDGRTLVAAARTGLEVSGLLRKDAVLPTKRLEELSVAELTEMIESTKRELELAERRSTLNVVASTKP